MKKDNSNNSPFLEELKAIAFSAKRKAYQAADQIMVVRNWLIGRRIVEEEQKGEGRAEYGKQVIMLASKSLTSEFGKGFSITNLKSWRLFYLTFRELQIGQTVLAQFAWDNNRIGQTVSAQSSIPFYPNLSWSHYERLMRVSDEKPACGICKKLLASNGVSGHWLVIFHLNTTIAYFRHPMKTRVS